MRTERKFFASLIQKRSTLFCRLVSDYLAGITDARALRAAMLFTVVLGGADDARAQPVPGLFGSPSHFAEQGGAALYGAICAGCHMPDGRGAVGAGAYPALAADPRLATLGYPIAVVLNGRHGMPGFAHTLSDQQVANVVDYIRTHFGNAYADSAAAADVAAAR